MRFNHAYYVTFPELYKWASQQAIHHTSYEDAAERIDSAIEAIAAFFDGSLGTYTDIMTGQTRDYPEICEATDIYDYFQDEFAKRLIAWALFEKGNDFTVNEDSYWYSVVLHFEGRIKRFCKFNKRRYEKLLQTMMIDYNPIADYWTNEKTLHANAPYITIANNKGEQGTYSDDPHIADWNQVAGTVDGAVNPMNGKIYKTSASADNQVKNEHFTTTYDDSSDSRLDSYDLQTGGTKTESESPTNGDFTRRSEEGNKGTVSPQDMVAKEVDLSALWNVVKLFLDELSKEIFLQTY